jgi:imidazole glycerol-phosphate synthase subunit HisH
MSIAIIDCGAGNLHSVRKAFEHVLGGDASRVRVTQDAADIAGASHVVLPGVGAFGDCVAGLHTIPGMRNALERAVLTNKKPFLGICVGMQMLFTRGYEHGTHEGLGWFAGEVHALTPADPTLAVPHMGWNALHIAQLPLPIWRDIPQGAHAYFVHSFHATGAQEKDIMAHVDYGGSVVAMVGRENIVATQFHPEKSQTVGLTLLRNFVQQKSEN